MVQSKFRKVFSMLFISEYRFNRANWLILLLITFAISSSWAAEVTDQSDERDFSQEEYEHYMKLICEIDADVHASLAQCEIDLGGPCIDRALTGEKDRVVFGTEETEGYPILTMHSIMDRSAAAQKRHMKMLVGY